jgi:hypothetical protein
MKRKRGLTFNSIAVTHGFDAQSPAKRRNHKNFCDAEKLNDEELKIELDRMFLDTTGVSPPASSPGSGLALANALADAASPPAPPGGTPSPATKKKGKKTKKGQAAADVAAAVASSASSAAPAAAKRQRRATGGSRLAKGGAAADGAAAASATAAQRLRAEKLVSRRWCQELRDELGRHGLAGPAGSAGSAAPQRQELALRCRLARELQRRAALVQAGLSLADVEALHRMPEARLDAELSKRRINTAAAAAAKKKKKQGQAAVTVRETKLRMLEEALIKDPERPGLRTRRYEFGRRTLKAEEYPDELRMNDADMREVLKGRFGQRATPRKKEEKRSLLVELIERELATESRRTLLEVVRHELGRRGLPSPEGEGGGDGEEKEEGQGAELEAATERLQAAFDALLEAVRGAAEGATAGGAGAGDDAHDPEESVQTAAELLYLETTPDEPIEEPVAPVESWCTIM